MASWKKINANKSPSETWVWELSASIRDIEFIYMEKVFFWHKEKYVTENRFGGKRFSWWVILHEWFIYRFFFIVILRIFAASCNERYCIKTKKKKKSRSFKNIDCHQIGLATKCSAYFAVKKVFSLSLQILSTEIVINGTEHV